MAEYDVVESDDVDNLMAQLTGIEDFGQSDDEDDDDQVQPDADDIEDEDDDAQDDQGSDDDDDSDNQDDTDDDQVDDDQVDDDAVDDDAVDDRYYTEDDLAGMTDFDKLDTSKIPPHLMPIYKSFQGMATRKQQHLSEQQHRYEQLMQTMQTQVEATSNDLNTMIRHNPMMAAQQLQQEIANIDAAIEKAVNEDDIFESNKLQFKRGKVQAQLSNVVNRVSHIQALNQDLYDAIPDFQTKSETLTEFVKNVVPDTPMTDRDIAYITDIAAHGPAALKLIKTINVLYDKLHTAKETVKQKVKKSKPKQLNKGGAGSKSSSIPDQSLQNQKQLKKLHKRAIESGSEDAWVDYLDGLVG